jgi:hypothetical protein
MDPFKIPDGQLCSNGKNCTHRAKSVWTNGSMMDIVHGNYSYSCECCALKAQLAHAQEMAMTIADLENKLLKSCEGE